MNPSYIVIMTVCFILWNFVVIWYIFPRFDTFNTKKNLATLVGKVVLTGRKPKVIGLIC
jgi:hypothetical protein